MLRYLREKKTLFIMTYLVEKIYLLFNPFKSCFENEQVAFPSYQLAKTQSELDFGKQISMTQRLLHHRIVSFFYAGGKESMSWRFYSTVLEIMGYNFIYIYIHTFFSYFVL